MWPPHCRPLNNQRCPAAVKAVLANADLRLNRELASVLPGYIYSVHLDIMNQVVSAETDGIHRQTADGGVRKAFPAPMPPELSAPSLSRTTAPMGRVAASSASCRNPPPKCVAGSEAVNWRAVST